MKVSIRSELRKGDAGNGRRVSRDEEISTIEITRQRVAIVAIFVAKKRQWREGR